MLHSYKHTLWALLWKQCGTYESFLDPWNVLQEASGRACSGRMGAERTCSPESVPSCHRSTGAAQRCEASLRAASSCLSPSHLLSRGFREDTELRSAEHEGYEVGPCSRKQTLKWIPSYGAGKLCFLPTSQLESTFTEKEKKQMPESDTSQEDKNGKKGALECDWESH